MKYANDVASVVVLTAGLSLLVALLLFPLPLPSAHFSLYSLSIPSHFSSLLSLALQLLLRQLAAH